MLCKLGSYRSYSQNAICSVQSAEDDRLETAVLSNDRHVVHASARAGGPKFPCRVACLVTPATGSASAVAGTRCVHGYPAFTCAVDGLGLHSSRRHRPSPRSTTALDDDCQYNAAVPAEVL
jgi:hypothetical protein